MIIIEIIIQGINITRKTQVLEESKSGSGLLSLIDLIIET